MSAATDLRSVLKRRVKALETHLPAALEGDPRSLHRARVASRRLREVLPLISTTGSKDRKRVRRLTVSLGRVREMDVALELLGSDELAGVTPRPTLAEARQHLQMAREKRRAKMLRRVEKLNLDKLGRALARFQEDASSEEADWPRVLAGRIARRVTALRRALEAAGAIYVPERLHAVRIAAKKLRYTLEIAGELGIREAATAAAVVRRTQVTLGSLQDRTVLLRQLRADADEAAAAARNDLAPLERELETSARELHAQFLSQRGALLAALGAIRQDVVPALAHASHRRQSLTAKIATATHGRTHRAVSDSPRARRTPRRRLA